MQRIPYKSIDLKHPVRVFLGRQKVTSVESVDRGAKIFRVFDGPLDFFIVEGGNAVPGVEIEASNIAGSVRLQEPAMKGKGGHAKRTKSIDPDDLANLDGGDEG